ncbi:ribonuclease P protein component [Massilia sp. 9096]|uniref:ribonuclease P protein component n=1 Tax=Massilia sp. 9096 TaxID=1500894 RepID=UPI0009E0610E|nr:ribonuclease P protein component [Massilia sp. 9096]
MTGEGSHDFARVRRIVKTDEFSSVFRLRPAFKTAHFVLYTRPTDLPHARLGVVAAKRFAPRAVTRNTIKRVTRELFRTTPMPSVDCIVRLARPVNSKDGPATTGALKALLRAELARLFASQAPRARAREAGGRASAASTASAPDAQSSGSGPRPS